MASRKLVWKLHLSSSCSKGLRTEALFEDAVRLHAVVLVAGVHHRHPQLRGRVHTLQRRGSHPQKCYREREAAAMAPGSHAGEAALACAPCRRPSRARLERRPSAPSGRRQEAHPRSGCRAHGPVLCSTRRLPYADLILGRELGIYLALIKYSSLLKNLNTPLIIIVIFSF